MSSKFGSWLIVAGMCFTFLGLCALPAAFGAKGEAAALGLAATSFSMGILLIAAGIYAKAVALKLTLPEQKPSQPAGRRGGRGACELCGTEQPVVHCKVHQLQLCGSCLSRHYDHRSCAYVPFGWSAAPVRSMAARRNG